MINKTLWKTVSVVCKLQMCSQQVMEMHINLFIRHKGQ